MTDQYLYAPLAFYQGRVLKAISIVDDTNRARLIEQYPGSVELAGYRGDRILADSYRLFIGEYYRDVT